MSARWLTLSSVILNAGVAHESCPRRHVDVSAASCRREQPWAALLPTVWPPDQGLRPASLVAPSVELDMGVSDPVATRVKHREKRCGQCGRTFRAKPCGFAHAAIGRWRPVSAKKGGRRG